jgi:enoyl reductase
MPAHFPQRLGNEFAGVIEAVADGETQWSVGDAVLGWSLFDAYADEILVKTTQVIAKPPTMGWNEAGVLSASGQTAATAITDIGLTAGETVLIHGGSGGVGSFAVQIARTRGAKVIATASARNHPYLRKIGAVPVAYGPGLAERIRQIAPEGVAAALVLANTEEAVHSSIDLGIDQRRIGVVAYVPIADKLGLKRVSTQRSQAQLERLADLHTQGQLRVAIEHVYALSEAPAAHTAMETGHVRGKLVLCCGP